MIEILALIVSLLVIGYLIVRMSRRGISKKYDRKPENSWSALNEGIDPTI
ncbi:unannotated protein [freshwater metagenome]|uniref:Unannotated protein n=1 Tax=freshwater metagenome TaxID=449393 RepID=A0A6J6S7W3_9ZZZZ